MTTTTHVLELKHELFSMISILIEISHIANRSRRNAGSFHFFFFFAFQPHECKMCL